MSDDLLLGTKLITGQMGVQLIPPSEPQVAGMPSGREYHTPKMYIAPALDEDVMARMRALPDPSDAAFESDGDSGDESQNKSSTVEAFPGTKREYSAGSAYY